MKENYLQNMFSMKNKVALVTGGGRGIGQVICRELARAGANIAIFSRSGASRNRLTDRIRGRKSLRYHC